MRCFAALAAVAVVATCAPAFGASEAVLYAFNGGNDGSQPAQMIVIGGTLYGTTALGGPNNNGTVFALKPSGGESVVHSFGAGADGLTPTSGLTLVGGHLFGSTYFGGGATCAVNPDQGCGALYSLAPDTGVEQVVYSFQAGRAGQSLGGFSPAGVVDVDGTVYGIAAHGGPGGFGAVFKLQHGVEHVVYAFKGASDGGLPRSLINVGGTLYGTTIAGGGAGCTTGFCGTVFKLTPAGEETVLYAFNGDADGSNPVSLVDDDGALVGVAANAGARGQGVVFRLRDGKETVLHPFRGGDDGAEPYGLVKVGDLFYGTTSSGGTAGNGTVFSVTRAGDEQVIHAFAGGDDGAVPCCLVHAGNKLYGSTGSGGAAGAGVVFEISP
jgi:uncharacterized repeat protein (TIGR03803 family)